MFKVKVSRNIATNNSPTVEPVYYGHLGTDKKCPDYQGVLIFQVILYDKVQFGTSAKCLDYAGVRISSVHINRFHCSIYTSGPFQLFSQPFWQKKMKLD